MLSLRIKNANVNFIGDPHLGKKFGKVQMHRRGEREANQMKQFEKELDAAGDITIMVGDLFDTFNVSNEVLIETANIIKNAALTNPYREFILMSGNHDISRDAQVKSSFHVLRHMLAGVMNVQVCMFTQEINGTAAGSILICPYSEFKTAKQEVEPYQDKEYDLVVGHWDTMVIAGEHNLVPLEQLSKMTEVVVTGHIHNKDTIEMPEYELTLHLTGSMLPYSHSEDPTGEIYVTKTIEQALIELERDPLIYKDKCLRLIVGKEEKAPDNIECLQISLKKVEGEEQKLEVVMEEFSFEALFYESMAANDVPDDVAIKYFNIYKEKANDDSQS